MSKIVIQVKYEILFAAQGMAQLPARPLPLGRLERPDEGPLLLLEIDLQLLGRNALHSILLALILLQHKRLHSRLAWLQGYNIKTTSRGHELQQQHGLWVIYGLSTSKRHIIYTENTYCNHPVKTALTLPALPASSARLPTHVS